MAEQALPVLSDYIHYLADNGKVQYMNRRNPPAIMIPGTQYWWGPDRSGIHDHCWHGGEAYNGSLPADLKERYPLWNIVVRFAQSYQRRLDADSWDDAKRAAYKITPEWVQKIDSIKSLCEDQKWSEAMTLYRELV